RINKESPDSIKQRNDALLMKDDQKILAKRWRRRAGEGRLRRHAKAVKEVVADDHCRSKNGGKPNGEVNKSSHHDHRNADDPNDLRHSKKRVVQIKNDRETNEREFEEDQPDPAGQKKPRELSIIFAVESLKIDARSGKENKYRCAKMR